MNLDTGSKLLINESPLTVLPSLVRVVGLDRAIILQQIQYLLQQKHTGIVLEDGEKYIWNTAKDFHTNCFPFWEPDTIRKHLKKLENDGYLIAAQPFAKQRNQTKHYRINYAKLNDDLCDLFLQDKIEEKSAEQTDETKMPEENVSDLDAAQNSESNRKIFRMQSENNAASHSEDHAGSLKEQRLQQRLHNTHSARDGTFSDDDDFPGRHISEMVVVGKSSAQAEFEQTVWNGLEERRVDSPFENPKWEIAIEYAYGKNFTAEEFLGCLDDCRSQDFRKGRVTPAIVTNNLADYVLRKGRSGNAQHNGDGEYINPLTGKGLK